MTQGNSLLGKFHLNEKRRLSRDTVRMCQTHPVFMDAQRGHPRVNEQATVCGLGHDRRGLMDCTSMFAEKNASMSRYKGNKPDNGSSGLKHWRNS